MDEVKKRNEEYKMLTELVGFEIIGISLGDSTHSPTIFVQKDGKAFELFKYHQFENGNVRSFYGLMPASVS